MKTFFTLIIAILSLGLQAQVYSGDEIKDKTEDAAENKVNNEIDNTINNTVDKGFNALKNSLFGKKNKKNKNKDSKNDSGDDDDSNEENNSQEQENYSNLQKLYGINSVEMDEEYRFTVSADIAVIYTDEKGKEENMAYKMYFPDSEAYFAMSMQEKGNKNSDEILMIFDYSNNQMVTLTESDGQKIGMAFPIDRDDDNLNDEKSDQDDDDYTMTRTGKTKTILGYTCDQYVYKGDDGTGEFWASQDKSLRIGFAMHALMMSGEDSEEIPEGFPEGAILEMNFNDADGSTMHWETISIDKKLTTISTKGYQFMSFGGK
jgi:uncharacterized protein DUF4412